MVAKLYYKNKLILKLIKPFENKRLFTSLMLNILTLKDYNYWPKNLIALDAFCQTGLQWTRLFANEANYLEMWDINEQAIKYAKKEFPNANINCGDSINAIINNKLHRSDFNFVLIDLPVPFRYSNTEFEHFVFFDKIFNNVAANFILILNVVTDVNVMLNVHPKPKEYVDAWVNARKLFYNSDDGYIINPQKMKSSYEEKLLAIGITPKLILYNARNQNLGIVTIVGSKSI